MYFRYGSLTKKRCCSSGVRLSRLFKSRRKLISLCASCLGIVLFLAYCVFPGAVERDSTCKQLKAREELRRLCIDYSKDVIGGNLCSDLCVSHHLTLPDCLAHKNTTIVFIGRWKDRKVVFKTKSMPSYMEKLENIMQARHEGDVMATELQEQFTAIAYEHVLLEVSSTKLRNLVTPRELLALVWKPHPLPNLTFTEMSSVWSMLHMDEFIRFQILQGLQHIPKVYGFCGRFYSVEKVVSLADFGIRTFAGKSFPPWKTRVKVALELLHLIKELSRTPLGELHHCDIQPANFGLTDTMRVVSLDVDTVLTTKQIEDFAEQPTCSKDADCDFFDCVSACNKTSGQCSRKLLTNNLQVMCRDVFLSRWLEPGLLQGASRASNKLHHVLTECASSRGLPWQQDKKEAMHQALNNLLSDELGKVR